MKYFFLAIIIIIYILGLLRNYKLDKGKNKSAKIINPILVVCIFLFYFSSSYDKIEWLLNSSGKFPETLYAKVFFIPAYINLTSWILYLVMSIWVVILTWSMIFRVSKSRLFFLRTIPILWLLECFELNRIINEQFGDNYIVLCISILLLSIIWFSAFFLFSRDFMKKFYEKV